MAELTPDQEAFCQAYVETSNASEAYRRAFPRSQGWKPTAVWPEASRLLNSPKVSARIEELLSDARKRHDVTMDKLTAELMPIALANAGEFFEWGPDGVTVKPSDELTREQRGIVSEVSQTVTEKGGTIRVKLHDKLSAIEKLARLHGIEPPVKTEITGKGGGPIRTESDAFMAELVRLRERLKETAIEEEIEEE